ncbi:hypothetical protein [Pinirhizobacter sp.]|uniref:hypothetical protein n=1 Tax=Pinirhizobacter sp. TaxID=2950432 RepID=UPI002F417F99
MSYPYYDDVEMRSRSPSSEPEPEPTLPEVNAGKTLSGEGTPVALVERAARLPREAYGGTNDCGIRSMAGAHGIDPSELLMDANSRNPVMAREQWDHHERNMSTREEYLDTAQRAGRPVTYEASSNFLRLPPRGQAAVVVTEQHARVMARSESGNHAAHVDFQAGTRQPFRVNRLPDAHADRVNQHAFMHGPSRRRDPSPER